MRTKDDVVPRELRPTRGRIRRGITLAAALLLSLLAALASLVVSAPSARAADSPLQIVVPKPSGGVVSGPVGTNVSFNGAGQPNHAYQIGYAPKDQQCARGFQAVQAQPVTAKGDGTFSATFPWPSGGTTSGTSYYVCAEDTVGLPGVLVGPLQSSDVFKVLAQDSPNIDVNVAASTGTPDASATPPPSGSYYAGSSIQITGANFLPGGIGLQAYVTTSQNFSSGDTRTYHPLVLDNGNSSFTSASNGAFGVTATLPQSPRGAVFLHVVSADASGNFPPALVGTQSITILGPQPTATPATPSPSTTAGATPSTTPTGQGTGGTGGTPDPGSVLAVIGLSGLSIILFIVGIILMTSASAMARTTPR